MIYQCKIKMPVSAQTAGEELERIERKNGVVTPSLVLDASRDEKAPLHKCFEWDNAKAAENYRLVQAGMIIRNVTVVHQQTSTEPIITRAFVNTSERGVGKEGAYISIHAAMSDDEQREFTLQQAIIELKQLKRKYQDLAELADVYAAIDKLSV